MSRWGEFWSRMKVSSLSSTPGEPLEPEVLFLLFSWCSLFPPARRCLQQGESGRPAVARAVCLSVCARPGGEALARSPPVAHPVCAAPSCLVPGRAAAAPPGDAAPRPGAAESRSIPLKRRLELWQTRHDSCLVPGAKRLPRAHGTRQGPGWGSLGRCCISLSRTSVLPPPGSGGSPRVRLPRDRPWPPGRAVI